MRYKNKFENKSLSPPETNRAKSFPMSFFCQKKKGGHRLILNLKALNMYTNKIHSKTDTLNTILKLVKKDCFMTSTDLKDAYYWVPTADTDRKYLCFWWNGMLYQYNCLANSISCAPRKFTTGKLLKAALTNLQLRSHVTSSYVDDPFLPWKTQSMPEKYRRRNNRI